jgi:glycosyltransferase involved in cell wall biosynthesis
MLAGRSSLPVSVVICTFNRSASLAHTLRSLVAQQNVVWQGLEVLVVDNNSTDETTRVVDQFQDLLPIKRIFESSQGLSFARNRALAEARGDWVLFTDDDVVLSENWLAAYIAALTQAQQFGFAGGRILPQWAGKPPRWFKGERLALLDGVLVWYDLGGEVRELLIDDPIPFGASFAVSGALAKKVGSFRVDLGVRGRDSGRGEETEWMMRALQAGARGLYVGNAMCWHVVDPHRLTFNALLRYGKESALAHKALHDHSMTGSRTAAAMYLTRGIIQLAKGRGDRFRQCVINAGGQLGLSSNKN